MNLPSSAEGKQGKCPSCGQIITVHQVTGAPEATPLASDPLASDPLYQAAQPVSTQKIFSQAAQSLATTDSASHGNNRYPNLSNYLALTDILIKIFFIIGLVILALALVYGILQVLSLLFRDFLLGLAVLVGYIVAGALSFLCLWLWRMFSLAGTEFVRVIMDIERNTRQTS
jgi:hypothetical protein